MKSIGRGKCICRLECWRHTCSWPRRWTKGGGCAGREGLRWSEGLRRNGRDLRARWRRLRHHMCGQDALPQHREDGCKSTALQKEGPTGARARNPSARVDTGGGRGSAASLARGTRGRATLYWRWSDRGYRGQKGRQPPRAHTPAETREYALFEFVGLFKPDGKTTSAALLATRNRTTWTSCGS